MVEESVELAAALKIIGEDAPRALQLELAKTSKEGAFAYGQRLLAPWMIERINKEAEFVGIENRANERQATRSHVPEYRIPVFMYHCFEVVFGNGCWKDKDFVNDTLKHYPMLRCKVKYGIKGQEYVKGH